MRWIGRIAKWLGLGIAGLLALGLVTQAIGTLLDRRHAPPVAEMVSVDGYRIHVFCRGTGAQTYLLDAGAGVGAFEWDRLTPLLAKSGRVCAFDRPGLGWSDDTGEAHDVATLADRIAIIVRAAKIPRPFIYVGHSLGANIATVYRERHPRDLAAMVLIEPGVPKDLLEDFHGTRAEAMNAADCEIVCNTAHVAAWFGVTRIGALLAGAGRKTLPEGMRQEYLIGVSRPEQIRATVATLNALPKSAYELLAVKSFGDTPVLVLTSSMPRKPESDETPEQFRRWRADELAYFATLAAMSTHGRGPIVLPDSNHATMVMGEAQAQRLAAAIAAFAAASVR